jgi:tetratricopeptide (TPR) repeat protein
LQERALGPDNPDIASTLTNLSIALGDLHRLDEALAALERAVRIKEKSLGPDHPSLAITLSNLGHSLTDAGKYPDAEKALLRSVAIKEKALGREHPSLAYPLTDLGRLYLTWRKPEKAGPPLERALTLREHNPCDPTDLAETRFLLAQACKDRRRALTLATQAEKAYADAGQPAEKYRVEVSAWLARH